MKTKYTIKLAVLSLLTAVAVHGENTKSQGTETEFGYYEQRISKGQVSATSAPYFEVSSTFNNLSNVSIIGSIELVEDSDRDQLHMSLGAAFDTSIGDIVTSVAVHKTETFDYTYELVGQYRSSPFDLVDAIVSLSLENGCGTIDYSTQTIYTPALNLSKTFVSSYFDLVLGGEVGKSYGFEDSFEYIQLYTRVETLINEKAYVYVQLNWLDNDAVVYDATTFASSENFDQSIQAGVSFKF